MIQVQYKAQKMNYLEEQQPALAARRFEPQIRLFVSVKEKEGKLDKADVKYRRCVGLRKTYHVFLTRPSLAGTRQSASCAERAAYDITWTGLWRYTAKIKEVLVFGMKTHANMGKFRPSNELLNPNLRGWQSEVTILEDSSRVTSYSTRISGTGDGVHLI